MPTLPVPIFVAVILGFMGLRAWAKGETPRPLLVLIAACAVQAAVVAGRLHYGIEPLSWVQPVLALALPPLAWVAFVAATRRPLRADDLWHLAGPAFGLFARIFVREALDPAILLSFLIYGAAVLVALRGTGEVAHARLGAGERPLRLWRWLGWALVLSGLTDVVMMGAALLGHQAWLGWMVTVFSTASLLALGALMLADEAATVADVDAEDTPRAATADDAAMVAALERLMAEKRLWLDPDLTLARIARRMGVPAKALSAAVNRVRGENISRVINGWRIAHATELLAGGAQVTEAMLGAGFNTKSNFNREFLRVMGQPPTQWLQNRPSEVP